MSRDPKVIALSNPVIVYDGHCLLCDHIIIQILKADKEEKFRFCTQNYYLSIYPGEPIKAHVMFYYQNHISFASNAVIDVLKILGGKYRILSSIIAFLPAFFREGLYRIIARNRYRWFGKSETCLLPPKRWSVRFIDFDPD